MIISIRNIFKDNKIIDEKGRCDRSPIVEKIVLPYTCVTDYSAEINLNTSIINRDYAFSKKYPFKLRKGLQIISSGTLY